jgi:hypothetical protein
MRSSEWLERLTANVKVATVLGSIPASSVTVDSEGRQMKQCGKKYLKIKKNAPILIWEWHTAQYIESLGSRIPTSEDADIQYIPHS